jgi:hypothetical protein
VPALASCERPLLSKLASECRLAAAASGAAATRSAAMATVASAFARLVVRATVSSMTAVAPTLASFLVVVVVMVMSM